MKQTKKRKIYIHIFYGRKNADDFRNEDEQKKKNKQ